MREILFRGKAKDEDVWEYGYYSYVDEKQSLIIDYCCDDEHLVDRNSVGQYIGLKDINGKKIFEGDIVKEERGYVEYYIRYDEEQSRFGLIHPESGSFLHIYYFKNLEVIDNIYDFVKKLKVMNNLSFEV